MKYRVILIDPGLLQDLRRRYLLPDPQPPGVFQAKII